MPAYKSALVMTLGACLLGCASPDLPTPRHAVVPVPVSDLSARQVGDTVILTFTLPVTSTDLQPLEEMPSVEIYRNTPRARGMPQKPSPQNQGRRGEARRGLPDTLPSRLAKR